MHPFFSILLIYLYYYHSFLFFCLFNKLNAINRFYLYIFLIVLWKKEVAENWKLWWNIHYSLALLSLFICCINSLLSNISIIWNVDFISSVVFIYYLFRSRNNNKMKILLCIFHCVLIIEEKHFANIGFWLAIHLTKQNKFFFYEMF